MRVVNDPDPDRCPARNPLVLGLGRDRLTGIRCDRVDGHLGDHHSLEPNGWGEVSWYGLGDPVIRRPRAKPDWVQLELEL